ncbi:MAG: hypothetical protein FWH12_08020 [Treponema sp.]|nr:hypothetical protein [Treponema sp.]
MRFFKFLPLIVLLMIGCAMAPSSYDSFSYRESDFNISNVTVSERGLTQEQIASILSTRFPPDNEVSIAVIFLQNLPSRYANVNDLSYYIMEQGRAINNVEKFVPIPRIFIPRNLTFDVIQDLGIRSLCEYTLIFYNSSGRSMTFSQLLRGEYRFVSDIEFSLIDNQTTAIIASDRLYTSIIQRRDVWQGTDMEEAEHEVYSLQAALLAEKLNELFTSR